MTNELEINLLKKINRTKPTVNAARAIYMEEELKLLKSLISEGKVIICWDDYIPQLAYQYLDLTKQGKVTLFINENSNELIDKYDIRSGQGSSTVVRSMSGGNQQKAIIAREIERDPEILVAVQPTRGLDVGAIENIHNQLINERDKGKAILVVSYELDEVLKISDRILVMFKGQIVGELDPKNTTREELGLYMAGSKNTYNFKEGD